VESYNDVLMNTAIVTVWEDICSCSCSGSCS
jgi:hypothetical protein